jgi:hypothetical protein
LEASRDWAAEQLDDFAEAAQGYLDGVGQFPERVAINALGARFMTDFYDLVDRWARWATEVVEHWPDDPSKAEPDFEVLRDIVDVAVNRAR